MSYANLLLYSAVLPSYDMDEDKSKDGYERFDAGDPKNIELIKAFSETYG